MEVLKSGKYIYGAKLTAAEKKAMNMEIKRQLAEWDIHHAREIDAMILYVLHTKFGFGEERLKRFYDGFSDSMHDLMNRYGDDTDDTIWVCTEQLKDLGIDLEVWEHEHY